MFVIVDILRCCFDNSVRECVVLGGRAIWHARWARVWGCLQSKFLEAWALGFESPQLNTLYCVTQQEVVRRRVRLLLLWNLDKNKNGGRVIDAWRGRRFEVSLSCVRRKARPLLKRTMGRFSRPNFALI